MNLKFNSVLQRPRSSSEKRFVLVIAIIVFMCPLLSSAAFASTYAYVPNSEAGTVSVIRTSDNTVTDTISVGQGPYGVAISPDGNYAYVTNREDGTVSVINTSDNEVTDTVTVGNDPMGIAVDPDGDYVYVANNSDDTVSVISTDGDESNVVIATIDVGNAPYGVAADPGGDYVYITNNGDDTVTVISTDEDPVTVSVGEGPLGITTDPDGDYVYVVNNLGNSLTVISIEGDNQDEDDDDEDDDDNTVVATVSVGEAPWGVAVVQNASSVYVTNSQDNTVSVISTSSRTLTATLSVGDEPLGAAAPQNGDFVYVVNYDDETISAIDTTDNTVSSFDAGEGTSPVGLGNFIGGRPPEAPNDLTADATSDENIDLTWTDNSYDELGFKIERRATYDDDDEFTQIAVVGSNVTSYTDWGLSAVTTYEYRVRAYNEAGNSDFSDEAEDQTEEDDSSSVSCFIGATSGGAPWAILFPFLITLLGQIIGRAFYDHKTGQ